MNETAPQSNRGLRAPRTGRPLFFGHRLTLRQFLTRWLLPLGLIAAVVVVGGPPLLTALQAADGAADQTASQARSQSSMPVEVAPAKAVSEYEVRKPFTGALVAGRRSRLGFERPGKILTLLVDEGDRVATGQPLAELDRRRLTASRQRVAAELAEARAVLAELVAGPRLETIAAAAAEVRSLAAELEVAQRNLSRRRQLVETAAISREEFDESFYSTQAAGAQLDAARKQLEELETGTRVERIAAQRARVEALRAQLADVGHELEDTILKAPFAGAITQRRVDEGVIVAAGDAVFDLIEDDQLEAWIGVPAEAAAQLEVGETFAVLVNGAEHPATVKSLRAELNPTTRTRNVVFTINPRSAQQLVAGQVARVVLSDMVQQRGFWAPTSALTPDRRGLWAIYVAEGEGPTRTVAVREVELLHTEGSRSFVRGTLEEGEAIIVAGGHKVVADQQVEVRP